MTPGVISDKMPLANDFVDHINILKDLISNHKECGWYLFLIQNIQDLFRLSCIRTVIKSKGAYFLFCIGTA